MRQFLGILHSLWRKAFFAFVNFTLYVVWCTNLADVCYDYLPHNFRSFSTFWISKEYIECHSSHPYSVDEIGDVFISEPIVIGLTFPMVFNASKEDIEARPLLTRSLIVCELVKFSFNIIPIRVTVLHLSIYGRVSESNRRNITITNLHLSVLKLYTQSFEY